MKIERERDRAMVLESLAVGQIKHLVWVVEASWNLSPIGDKKEVDSLTAYHLTNSISDGSNFSTQRPKSFLQISHLIVTWARKKGNKLFYFAINSNHSRFSSLPVP